MTKLTDELVDRPTVEADVFLRYVERFTLAAINRYTDVPVEREELRRTLSNGAEPIGDAEWEALGYVAEELVAEAATDLESQDRPRSVWTTSIAQAVVAARLSEEEREAVMRSRIEDLTRTTGMPALTTSEWQGYIDRARDIDSEHARAIPDVQWDAVADTPGAEFGFVSLGNARGVDEEALAHSIRLAHDTRPNGTITFENENRRWDSLWLDRRAYVERERTQRLQGLRDAGIEVPAGSPQARQLTADLRDPEPIVSHAEVAARRARYAPADAAPVPKATAAPRSAAPTVDPSRVVPAAQQQQRQSLLRRLTRR